ncbi:hypothetical protein [Viridibacillus arvi]|uniref:hypothetical protein n=1 Tax=Viridibacillus arvi TaxID=263475 RepID=UPI0034CDA1EF
MFFYSYIILWILVTALTLSTIVIIRKITPAKPRLEMDDEGLGRGSTVPIIKFKSLSKKTVNLIEPTKSGTLVIYLSINCSACSNVLAYLSTYIKTHNDVSVVVFMRGENEREILQKTGDLINYVPIILLTDEYIESFKISLFPFAYFLSSKGIVLEKGGVPAGKTHLELLTRLAQSGSKLAS